METLYFSVEELDSLTMEYIIEIAAHFGLDTSLPREELTSMIVEQNIYLNDLNDESTDFSHPMSPVMMDSRLTNVEQHLFSSPAPKRKTLFFFGSPEVEDEIQSEVNLLSPQKSDESQVSSPVQMSTPQRTPIRSLKEARSEKKARRRTTRIGSDEISDSILENKLQILEQQWTSHKETYECEEHKQSARTERCISLLMNSPLSSKLMSPRVLKTPLQPVTELEIIAEELPSPQQSNERATSNCLDSPIESRMLQDNEEMMKDEIQTPKQKTPKAKTPINKVEQTQQKMLQKIEHRKIVNEKAPITSSLTKPAKKQLFDSSQIKSSIPPPSKSRPPQATKKINFLELNKQKLKSISAAKTQQKSVQVEKPKTAIPARKPTTKTNKNNNLPNASVVSAQKKDNGQKQNIKMIPQNQIRPTSKGKFESKLPKPKWRTSPKPS
ncbi:hypothetical protein BLNAU_13088 [Blattamonas nauphoetae]|uniref:Uncharacterized protein n=1 Tax=Blattamonas nauphoetae TaxID=2049346 RepID=A0ABQ9XHR8_9EUKA|nr:hypothetical protein BLNAU_13088 [Blattamonas nauphoetae]